MSTIPDQIIRDCCEAEVAEFGKPDTICIHLDDLRAIVQRHSRGQCLHQIAEPAPAAVAVPDSSNLGFAIEQRGDVWVVVEDSGGVCPASSHECALWNALIEARAALAAAPAAPAPVVMNDGLELIKELVQSEAEKTSLHREFMGKPMPALTYDRFQRLRDGRVPALWQQVRALLAGVSAPAVPVPSSTEPPFLHRLRIEQRELTERQEKLDAFLKTPAFRMLANDDQALMVRQSNEQHALLQTLNQRIHSAAGKHLRSTHHG